MAASYSALRDKFLDWSNRDVDVFNITNTDITQDVIYDFFKYAADKAYRTLRIPVFERTYSVTISDLEENNPHQDLIDNNRLPVPVDLTEFVHIRLKNAFGNANSLILNEKADTRTFHDYYAEKYDVEYTWTRQGRYIYLPRNPGIVSGQQWEIFYYGRLPQIGSSYDTTYENFVLGVVQAGTTEQSAAYYDPAMPVTPDDFDALAFKEADEVNNWFVHENERVLLFGALAEAFAYLSEEDMMQKYVAMFTSELQELNKEEEMRHASGGNIRMNFDGRGLI